MTNTATTAKPPKVGYALYLLYSYLAIGVAACFFVLPEVAEQLGLWVGDLYVLAFFTLGFSAGFILEIRKGKNWARITFVVLSYLVIALSFGFSFWSPTYSPFRLGAFSLLAIIGSIACAFLIQPEASTWFEAMERARKESAHRILSAELKVCSAHDPAEWKNISADEPLLVVQYHEYKHAWRVCWMAMTIMFFGPFAIWVDPGKGESEVMRFISQGFFWFMTIGGLYAMIDLVRFGEIRFYKDRVVQTKKLKRDIVVRLADAGYMSYSGYGMRPTFIFDRKRKNKWIARIKGIRYDEKLMASSDLAKLHLLLAALTGRKSSDFEAFSVKFPQLVNHQPQPDRPEYRDLAESS